MCTEQKAQIRDLKIQSLDTTPVILNSEPFWKREPTQENNISQVWNREVPLSNKMVITDNFSNYMRMVEEIKGYYLCENTSILC